MRFTFTKQAYYELVPRRDTVTMLPFLFRFFMFCMAFCIVQLHEEVQKLPKLVESTDCDRTCQSERQAPCSFLGTQHTGRSRQCLCKSSIACIHFQEWAACIR